MSEQTEEPQSTEEAPKEEAPAPETPPPKAKVPETKEKGNHLLDLIEADYVSQLKDDVDLEEFAEFDQEVRIKMMRSLQRTLAKQKKVKKDEPLKRGKAKNPADAPPPNTKHIPTNLERNNAQEFTLDIAKKNSIPDITERLRGRFKNA